MSNPLDLTGRCFGRLTVLRLHPEPYVSPSGKTRGRQWICRCDCGNEVTVSQRSLTAKSHPAGSCGCLRGESARASAIDLTGQRFGRWLVLGRERLPKPLAGGTAYGWRCRCDCGSERVIDRSSLVSGRSKSCGCDRSEKAAERALPSGENVFGRYDGTAVSAIRPGLRPLKNNVSGVRGVYYETSSQRWVASIGLRREKIKLGRFVDKEDAILARKAAEEKYFAPILAAYEAERA